MAKGKHQQLSVDIKTWDKKFPENIQEYNEEGSNEYSITPNTFFARILLTSGNEGTGRYVEKYLHSGNEVLRFGIDTSKVNGEAITREGLVVSTAAAKSVKSAQYKVEDAEKVQHHSLEKESMQDAINHLLTTDAKTVLVDILEREAGTIKLKEESSVETHTILLYKNPEKDGKHEIVVIDPSNFLFSSHLLNFNQEDIFEGKNLGELFPKFGKLIVLHKGLQVYNPGKEGTGPDIKQARDCIDIAVKLAFGLNNKGKDFSIQTDSGSLTDKLIKELDVVQHVSNVPAIDKTIVVDSISRIKQASNVYIREEFYKSQSTFKIILNILQISDKDEYGSFLEQYEQICQSTLEELVKYLKTNLTSEEYKNLLKKYKETFSTASDFQEAKNSEISYILILESLKVLNQGAIGKVCLKLGTLQNGLDQGISALLKNIQNPWGDGIDSYTDSSYWNRYSKEGLKNILDLRLKSASLDIEKAIVIHPNYVFSEETAQVFVNDLVAQISSTGLGVEGGNNSKSKLLIPVNLGGKHWVGMVVESADSKVKVTYMDSEGNSMPATLKECLEAELTWIYPNAGIEVTEQVVEQQVSNNCGLHVIENLIAAVIGEAARIDQEDALAVHTTLLEETLLEEAWPHGKATAQSVLLSQAATKRQAQQLSGTELQTAVEPWYYGAEKVIASMAGKIVGSFVDALRMAMYVDPYEVPVASVKGYAVASRATYSPELREALSQYKAANSGKSFNDRDKFSDSLQPVPSLLDGIELSRADFESWLQQFKSEAPLLGE